MSIRKLPSLAVAVGIAALSLVVAPSASAAPGISGSYNSVESSRILDTRTGFGAPQAAVPAGGTVTFDAAPGVEGTVAAVALNLTAVSPLQAGYLTAYPAGTALPTASNLNFQAGQDVPNLVVVKVGAGNKVTVFNGSNGSVNVLADIHGYFAGGAAPADAGLLVPSNPTRVLDTRTGVGAPKKRAAPYSVTKLQIGGVGGIPADASAVVLNLTAVLPSSRGFLTAYEGDPVPAASTINYELGRTRANLTMVELAADGSASIYNGSSGPLDIVADVSGYFIGGTPSDDGSFLPTTPFRAFDSRLTGGRPAGALTTSKIQIFPSDDPVYSFFSAVTVDVVAVDPQASGFLTTWDGDGPLPSVSSSNFVPNSNVAGSVVVPVNPDGTISIYNGSYGNVDLVVDITGFFLTDPSTINVVTGKNQPASRHAPDAKTLAAAVAKLRAHPVAAVPTSVTTQR